MNDFTKEELQIIHLDMTIYAEKTKLLKESPSHKSLRDKVISMIDNYCEQSKIYIVTGHDGCDSHIEKLFTSEDKANKYKGELYIKCNDGHENGEYTFSVHERILEK